MGTDDAAVALPLDDPNDAKALRVILRRIDRRVLVEIIDGEDAAGQPRWRRLDPQREPPAKRKKRYGGPSEKDRHIADDRRAYAALEKIAASLYDRAISAESRALHAEERARATASGRMPHQRPVALFQSAASVKPPPDPLADAKQRLAKLLELAAAPNTPAEEARNAAMAFVKVVQTHPEILK